MRYRYLASAGLATGLLLSAAPCAIAASLTTPGQVLTVAREAVGPAQTINPQSVTIVLSVTAGGFLATQQFLSYTLTNAQFGAAVNAAGNTPALMGFTFPAGCAPNITLSSGGGVGQSTVKFIMDTAALPACTSITWKPPFLKGLVQGADITANASVTLPDGTTNVDNGVSVGADPAGVMYRQIVCNKGTAGVATNALVDIPAGGKTFVFPLVPGETGPTSTLVDVSGTISDTIPVGCTMLPDTTVPFTELNAVATGTLTLTGIPSAVTAAPTLSGSGATCSAPAGGASTCPLSNAQMTALVAASPITASFTVNGSTVISNTSINANLTANYGAPNFQTAPEVKLNTVIANIGTRACAAEYASVVGANNSGFVSTIRMSNVSAVAGRLFAVATNDSGAASSAVVQLTRANTAVNAGLDAGNLLQPGASAEILGSMIESATGITFAGGSDGFNRGRVRLMLEGATGTAGASGALPGGTTFTTGAASTAGCLSEGFICFGNTCTLMQQTKGGVDGTPVATQNK